MMYELFQLIGRDYFYEGRMYNSYYISHVNTEFKKPYYYHYYDVKDDKMRKVIHKVIIQNNGETIYGVKCDCGEFNHNDMCKHVAGVLVNNYYSISRYEYIDELLIGNKILNSFEKKEIINNKIKRKVNVEVELVFDTNPLSFRLLVGTSKMYVVTSSKLNNFLYAVNNNKEMSFGKQFTFDGLSNYFDPEGQKIIDFLKGYQDSNRYYSVNPYFLSKREMMSLINMLGNANIKIKDYGIAREVIHGMPTKYHLDKDDNYTLTIDDYSNYHILSSDSEFIFYKNNLYVLSSDEARIINILRANDIKKIAFEEKDIDLFKNGLFNNIKKNMTISENIDNVKLPTKPEVNMYFDISNLLKCRLEFDYNGEVVNYFDKDGSFRSVEDENIPADELVVSGFEAKNKYFTMEDSDEIYGFIENKLGEFNDKYHVFLDKKLQNTKFLNKLNIQNNFSIGQDNILSYKFSVKEISNDELANVFKALRLKKKYYKLKNNQIVNLLDGDLGDLNDIMENLDIKNGDIENGEVVVPKYRAIYIDSLKDKYQNIETNNLFNKFIENFKKYQNIKLKLDKKDLDTLRDYQIDGVKWLYTIYKCNLGGILADEMGLGKTLQTITLIKHILKEKENSKILIVSPTSLVYNWKKEFDKFAPNLKYTTVSESKNNRLKIFEEKDKYNVFITSYGLVSNDNDEYEKIDFELCIIDEGQMIKNYKANMTQEVKKIKANCKITLTGTPIENNLTELWSIFDFIMPGYLNNVTNFRSKYNVNNTDEDSKKILLSLKEQIKPFILRRKKSDVLNSLPEKIENNLYVELPEKQKLLYMKEVKETKQKIDELVGKEGFLKSKMEILSLLTRLREICIDPNVIFENYNDVGIKMDTLLSIIKENILNNHKMLIFSSFKRVLDNVEKMLNKNGIASFMIDGSVKSMKRLSMVEDFNKDKTPCFLITLKAGGTGLNLVGADTVIHLDIWWNPQVENQATDRAHRIGQTKNVTVTKIICKDTIEEHIMELQEKKKFLSDNLIEDNNNVKAISKLSESDIKKLLSFSNEEME